MPRPRIGATTATTIVITIMTTIAVISSGERRWRTNSDSAMARRRRAAMYGRASLSIPIRAAVSRTPITVIAVSLAANTNIANSTRKPIAKAMNVPLITGTIQDGVGRSSGKRGKGPPYPWRPLLFVCRTRERSRRPAYAPDQLRYLFRLERFFDRQLLTFLDSYNPMQAAVTGHGDIENVGSGIQVKVERRSLVEHAAIHRDLRALGLR